MKKSKAKNLSKKQLKKLKGGLIHCDYTGCYGGTCGGTGKSDVYCADTNQRTVNISNSGGSGTSPKTKK